MPAALFLDAAVAFLKRYKAFALALPLLIALALSHWSDKRHTRQRDEARAENVALIEKGERNAAEAIAQHKAWEAKSAQIAKDTENEHVKALADARDAVARYAATHRVRSSQSGVSTAPQAGEGNSSSVPESPAAEALVSVSEADLTTCATNYTYAQSAYEWAKGLVDQGLAH